MAFIGIQVPQETAKLLSLLDVPGKKESVSHLHITLAYLGNDISMEQVLSCVVSVYSVVSNTKPFTVECDKISTFDSDDDIPIILPIHSSELHKLREKLCDKLEQLHVKYSKKYPEFKPHVTLSLDLSKKSSIDQLELLARYS